MPVTMLSDFKCDNPENFIGADKLKRVVPDIISRGSSRYVLSEEEELFMMLFPAFRRGINISTIAAYADTCYNRREYGSPFGFSTCTSLTEFETMLNDFLNTRMTRVFDIVYRYTNGRTFAHGHYNGRKTLRDVLLNIIKKIPHADYQKYNVAFHSASQWTVVVLR